MAIKIKVNTNAGLDVNGGNDSYLDTLPSMFDLGAMNFGYFYKNLVNATAYGLAETKEGSVFSGGAALLATGKLSYDLSTHEVTGKLNSIAFGRELEGLSGGYGTTSSRMSLGETDISFSGLGLNDKHGNDVNEVLYGLMTGDADAFETLLATSAVSFKGGKGDDTYSGGNQADNLHGKGGGDTLSGGKGSDWIFGEGGADILDGGRGADRISGDGGADSLTGGKGSDQFIFNAVNHSRPDNADTITDFDRKEGDRIVLEAIDAVETKSKNQSFDFIGRDDFSHTAGELRYEKSGGQTFIYGDVDGDGAADLEIQIFQSVTLRESDFVL